MSGGPRAVLVGAVRTPIGRLGGVLARMPAVELGAVAARGALERCGGLQPDYVAMGNVLQAANGQNPARQAAARAGVDRRVPGITLNDVCLASMSAVGMAATMVTRGDARAVLVGGFESMTQAPHAVRIRTPRRMGDAEFIDTMVRDGLWCSIEEVGMGELSERENARLGISRADQDEVATTSHQRAAAAAAAGRFDDEIVSAGLPADTDEGIRPETTSETLARLPPAFTPDGTITAGNASQLSDAGAAGVVTTLDVAREERLEPLCEIVDRQIVAGPDSSLHLQPAHASHMLLDRNGLTPADVDLWEINEAYAGVLLATTRDLGLELNAVNVNGGAIALGHPLGASALRLILTLAYELRRRHAELGVAALCGGGGQGEAMLVRAL
jgi:acetyl-CoA C-acetyltransferase